MRFYDRKRKNELIKKIQIQGAYTMDNIQLSDKAKKTFEDIKKIYPTINEVIEWILTKLAGGKFNIFDVLQLISYISAIIKSIKDNK